MQNQIERAHTHPLADGNQVIESSITISPKNKKGPKRLVKLGCFLAKHKKS